MHPSQDLQDDSACVQESAQRAVDKLTAMDLTVGTDGLVERSAGGVSANNTSEIEMMDIEGKSGKR